MKNHRLFKIHEFVKNIRSNPSQALERAFTVIFLFLLLIPVLQKIITGAPLSTEIFPGRAQMLSVVSNFKYHVLKDRSFDQVVTNQDGWLIYTGENSLDDFQNTNRFTKKELDKAKSRLNSLCSTLTDRGIRLLIVVPPNKNTIYPERVPPEIPQLNSKSRLDQILEVWEDTPNCKLLDLRKTFLDAKSTEQIYYATDTHWTDKGAFLAYQQIARMLQADFPQVKVRPISDFNQETITFAGDLGEVIGRFNETEQVPALTPNFKANYTLNPYSHPGTDVISKVSTTGDEALPTAVVFHDSFFLTLFQFLCENFEEAHYFWAFGIDLDLVNALKPDYLILEVTERYLANAIAAMPNQDSEK